MILFQRGQLLTLISDLWGTMHGLRRYLVVNMVALLIETLRGREYLVKSFQKLLSGSLVFNEVYPVAIKGLSWSLAR
jgi:hypothetical protein